MSSATTKPTITTKDLPRFDGRHYKKWVDEIMPTISLMDLLKIIDGTLVEPAAMSLSAPIFPVPTGNATEPTGAQLAYYQAKLAQYNSERDWHGKQQSNFDSKNIQAIGLFNTCLSTGIWGQVKMKDTTTPRTAFEIWDELKKSYAVQQFVEVLDDFDKMKEFLLDLSDPVPQLAKFRFYYSRLPMKKAPVPSTTTTSTAATAAPKSESIVSESMASLLLLSSLPLNTDPAQQSIYQQMVEEFTKEYAVEDYKLDTLTDEIRHVWAARFGNVPDSQKPRKGTLYLKKGDKAPPAKKQNVQQAQKTSAVKDKGPNPSFSQQQSQHKGKAPASRPSTPGPSSSAQPSDDKKKKKNRRAPRKVNARLAIDAPPTDSGIRFEIAQPAIIHPPSLHSRISSPAPHSSPERVIVSSMPPLYGNNGHVSPSRSPKLGTPLPGFTLADCLPREIPPSPTPSSPEAIQPVASPSGSSLLIRTEKTWKPSNSAPYPNFHKAKSLADRLGVTPTIQTMKSMEEVVKLDEIRRKQEVKKINDEANRRFAKIQARAARKRKEREESDSDGEADYPSDGEGPILPIGRVKTPDPGTTPSSSPQDVPMNLYPYAAPSSPISPQIFGAVTPRSTTPEPYLQDDWHWGRTFAERFKTEEEIVEHNTSWTYVPSFHLRANIVLIDPSAAEQAVDSGIEEPCICKIEFESKVFDLLYNATPVIHRLMIH